MYGTGGALIRLMHLTHTDTICLFTCPTQLYWMDISISFISVMVMAVFSSSSSSVRWPSVSSARFFVDNSVITDIIADISEEDCICRTCTKQYLYSHLTERICFHFNVSQSSQWDNVYVLYDVQRCITSLLLYLPVFVFFLSFSHMPDEALTPQAAIQITQISCCL